MSEISDEMENEPDVSEQESDAQFSDIDEDIRIEPARPSRIPLLVALLALLLAGVALAGVAWLYLTDNPPPVAQDNSEIEALGESVRTAETSLSRLRESLKQLADQDSTNMRQLEALRRDLDRRLQAYESLPGRVDNVESSVSSIQGISAGVRDTWLLAEAEYFMQIANAQLQLAGNPKLARLALLQADDRILKLANPALTNVRRALSNELRALEAMGRPDIEGITLTLASLSDTVDSLPLRQDVDLAATDETIDSDELSGLDRAIDSLKSTMSDIVSVRRTDEEIRPLMAPESAYFLRANLSLQLQAARLALLRGERSIYEQSLDDASQWIAEFYDTESMQVKSTMDTLAEVRDSLFTIDLPDISESLKLLRQYATLSATEASTPEANDAPVEEPVDDAIDEASEVPPE